MDYSLFLSRRCTSKIRVRAYLNFDFTNLSTSRKRLSFSNRSIAESCKVFGISTVNAMYPRSIVSTLRLHILYKFDTQLLQHPTNRFKFYYTFSIRSFFAPVRNNRLLFGSTAYFETPCTTTKVPLFPSRWQWSRSTCACMYVCRVRVAYAYICIYIYTCNLVGEPESLTRRTLEKSSRFSDTSRSSRRDSLYEINNGMDRTRKIHNAQVCNF